MRAVLSLGRAAFVLLIAVTTSVARAEAPICFPERTVLLVAELNDEQGRRLGAVRAGQLVRVLEDRVGKDRAFALVEVDAPIRVRGYVPRNTLRVFFRRDTVVESGHLWWLKGAAVRPGAGTGNKVKVEWVGPHEESGEITVPEVSCSDLTGSVVGKLSVDRCHGASPSIRRKARGQPVHFKNEITTVLDRSSRVTIQGHEVGLIREHQGRALVEVVQNGTFVESFLIRAWVAGEDVLPGPPPLLSLSGHGCCEGFVPMELGARGAPLISDVDLHVEPGAAPFARAPAGMRFRVLGEPRAGMRQIAFRFPSWDHDSFRFAIEGWAPVSRLPAVRGGEFAEAVIGRLSVKGAPAPKDFSGFEIRASVEQENGPPAALAGSDGRFLLEVHVADSVRLDARSPDGRLAGSLENVSALPGGEEEVSIELRPAAHIQGRVRNRMGAWLPNVEVLALADGAENPSVRAVSDGRGRFRLAVTPGKYSISASDPGMQWVDSVDARAPGRAVEVQLWRRRVLLGAVPAAGTGCSAREIEIRTTPSSARLSPFVRRYPVAADCTFAATEIGRAWNSFDVSTVADKPLTRDIGDRQRDDEHSWDEDPEPICLGDGCTPGWQRSGVYASVVDRDNVLVSGPTVVEVTHSTGKKQTCEAVAGTCFVYGLPPVARAEVKARQGARSSPSTSVDLKARVHDVLLRLP
jgi:hypothetical protein